MVVEGDYTRAVTAGRLDEFATIFREKSLWKLKRNHEENRKRESSAILKHGVRVVAVQNPTLSVEENVKTPIFFPLSVERSVGFPP